MVIILKKISATTKVADVEDFIAPALKGGFFNKSGRIEGIMIEMIEQAGSSLVEFHAIVRVEPELVASRVIRTLNRKRCNGKPINVFRYYFRQRGNDRRENVSQPDDDRRKTDRRRKNLMIKDVTAEKKGFKVEFSVLNPVP